MTLVASTPPPPQIKDPQKMLRARGDAAAAALEAVHAGLIKQANEVANTPDVPRCVHKAVPVVGAMRLPRNLELHHAIGHVLGSDSSTGGQLAG